MLKRLQNNFLDAARKSASKTYLTAREIWRHRYIKRVALERILCGGEHGLNGQQYTRHSGDFKRTSTPIYKSPHTKFLNYYQQIGNKIFEPDVFTHTEYYSNAINCINFFGSYFSATKAQDIHHIARNFIKQFEGMPISRDELPASSAYSGFEQPVTAFPVKYSDYYQVLNGNHRLAIACAKGLSHYSVRVIPEPQLTTLQQLLLDVAWNANRLELYQPIESPELTKNWLLVRRCYDRLSMMKDFLSNRGFLPPRAGSYLDVACNYGWFVKNMCEMGYRSKGVEIDWAARQIGLHFCDLHDDQLIRSEAVRYLTSVTKPYDVVSCFSLIHHFVMGRGSTSAEELIQLLDQVTKSILFVEMGDENEAWFCKHLAGWNPKTIESWILRNTTFKYVLPLGHDEDRVAPFSNNYNRTLFACVR